MTRARLRAVLVTLALVAAGVAFAAGVTVLTSSIASPEIGLRGDPDLDDLAPAPTPRTTTDRRPTTTARERTRTAPTVRTTTAAPPAVVPPVDGDDSGSGDDDGDSGRGRGRNRGRGGDD